MRIRHTDASILDALWSWCGHVTEAAAAIGMVRSAYYERLPGLGVGAEQLRLLRETGRLELSGPSGTTEYVPSPGTVRYIQPLQDSLLVRMQSGDPPHTFGANVSASNQAVSTGGRRLNWRPAPSRATTIAFEQAVIDLARVGKDVTKDSLLDAIASSSHFQTFMAELVALYRTKEEMGPK
jgi:hypothetical protein